MRTEHKRLVCRGCLLAADAVWLGLIFGQSLRTAAASSQTSGGLAALVGQLLAALGLGNVPGLEHLLRKLAHFGEFFILGALAALTLAAFLPRQRAAASAPALLGHPDIGWACLAGLLAGLADETLQLTSAGRSAQVSDVWLDWAGYLCGLAALAAFRCLFMLLRSKKTAAQDKEM